MLAVWSFWTLASSSISETNDWIYVIILLWRPDEIHPTGPRTVSHHRGWQGSFWDVCLLVGYRVGSKKWTQQCYMQYSVPDLGLGAGTAGKMPTRVPLVQNSLKSMKMRMTGLLTKHFREDPRPWVNCVILAAVVWERHSRNVTFEGDTSQQFLEDWT